MPILRNAKKALRVSIRKTEINRRVKSQIKTKLDSYNDAPSAEGLNAVFSVVDKAVKGKLFHRNKAARIKSRLSKKIAGVVAEKPAKVAKATKTTKAAKTTKTAKATKAKSAK
jgi:ribosomal protein S20